MVRNIHHVNFLVRDLDSAVRVYEHLLGRPVASRDSLPDRGVNIARFRLGETWLVLVQPVREDTAPARHLAEHGEGFFLLSLGVDCVDQAIADSGLPADGPTRAGLDDWRVRDLDSAGTFGVQVQYCQQDYV